MNITSNVAAVMGTRNCDLETATRIVLRNMAIDKLVDEHYIDIDETIEFLMLQLDLLPNQRTMIKRTPRGLNGHKYPKPKKKNVTVIANDARRVITVGSTQADFD